MLYDKMAEVLLRFAGITEYALNGLEWGLPCCQFGNCRKHENLQVLIRTRYDGKKQFCFTCKRCSKYVDGKEYSFFE